MAQMGREVNLESRKTGKRRGIVIRRLTPMDADFWAPNSREEDDFSWKWGTDQSELESALFLHAFLFSRFVLLVVMVFV